MECFFGVLFFGYIALNVVAAIAATITWVTYSESLGSSYREPNPFPENYPTNGAKLFFMYGLTMWFLKFCFTPRGKVRR